MPVGDANAGAGHREKPRVAPPRSPYLGTAGTDISSERCTTSQASRGSAVKRSFAKLPEP